MAPERIGAYRIVGTLASGPAATAYLAQHETLGSRVVIKVLAPELSADEVQRERFLQEARALARLSHPNVVKVTDAARADSLCYLVMEHVDGPSVRDLYGSTEPVPVAKLLKLARGVAAGLQHVHAAGLVHRDLAPANLLIAPGGEVKIADLGGGPATGIYASPEQALSQPLDGRSDLYALGVVLYEGLAGRPPFEGDSATALSIKHVRQDPPPLSKTAPGAPPELAALVMRLLRKLPAERPADATAVVAELDALLSRGAPGHLPVRPPRPAAPGGTARRPGHRRPLVIRSSSAGTWVALGLGGAALLVLAIVLLRRGPTGAEADAPEARATPTPAARESGTPTPAPRMKSPADGRRRVAHLARLLNHAGVAAGFCELSGRTAGAAQLKSMMESAQVELDSLREELERQGYPVEKVETLRAGDQLTWFNKNDLAKGGPEAVAELGTFAAKLPLGVRPRVGLLRRGQMLEFAIEFDERPAEWTAIIQVAGLIPGQQVDPGSTALAPPPVPSAAPTAAPTTPPPPPGPDDARFRELLAKAKKLGMRVPALAAACDELDAAGAGVSPALQDEALVLRVTATVAGHLHAWLQARVGKPLELPGPTGRVTLSAVLADRIRVDRNGSPVEMMFSDLDPAWILDKVRPTILASEIAPEAVLGLYLASRGAWEAAFRELAKTACPHPLAVEARRRGVGALVDRIDGAVKVRKWDVALPSLKELLEAAPDDPASAAIRGRTIEGVLAEARDLARRKQKPQMEAVLALVVKHFPDAKAQAESVRAELLWTALSDPKQFGFTHLKIGSPIRLAPENDAAKTASLERLPYDIDGIAMRIRLEGGGRAHGGITLESRDRLAYVTDADNFMFSHMDGGKWEVDHSEVLPHQKEYLLEIVLEGGDYLCSVDGVPKLRVKTKASRLAGVGIQASHGPVVFDQIRVRKKE